MVREGGKGTGFDHLSDLQVYRATGELLDDGMVITQFYAPYILGGVVVVRVGFVEAVTATPDAFTVVELVGGPGLFGLVVDAKLQAVSRTEHRGFTAAIHAGFRGPVQFVDAGYIPVRAGTAMHVADQIGGRRPALQV